MSKIQHTERRPERMENTLTHYGILGQKWGVRRYQNADGTLTAAGKARYGKALSVGGSYEELNKTIKESSNIIQEANKSNSSIRDIRKQSSSSKMDLSQMSDSELQKEVSRMNLEQQYKNLKSSQKVSGQTYVQNTLNVAGSVLAATASALTIATAIKKLKGG